MASALLMVDLQNDFCAGGRLAAPDADAIIPVANRVQNHFEHIIATQDWHPSNHASFAANQPGHQIGDTIFINHVEQILWPAHCVQHTPGAEFHPQLHTDRIEHIVRKGTECLIDSYSGFFDIAQLKKTDLDDYLHNHHIDTLFILGLVTDYCVKYTVLDALRLGYKVKVIVDACRGVNLQADDSNNALALMSAQGAQLLLSTELL